LSLVVAAAASFAIYKMVPERQVEVPSVHAVVAAKSLETGTVLTPDDVKLIPWPARNPVPGGFVAIEGVVNRGLISSVVENEPLTETKLAPLGAGGGLPPSIPAGMRAVSVKVDEVVGVAGFVVPGTKVDVLVTIGREKESISRVVLSNVQVLTAGTKFDQENAKAGKPIPSTVVTLLVIPSDAEKIALASQEGKIMLALRNPMDVQPSQTSGIRTAALIGEPSPTPVIERPAQGPPRVARPKPAGVPVAAEPVPQVYKVEAIRAAKRSEEVVR